MSYGWVGKTARINLASGQVTVEPSEQYHQAFLGGKGINASVLWNEAKPEIRPLDPESPLIIGTGPLVGTLVPTGCKCSISAKSPLTGRYGDSNIGGYWPAELKYAGFDQIIITGRAEAPAFLLIDDGAIELRDARHLWGRDTDEATRLIKADLGKDIRVITIGPAGENLVACASIVSWPSCCASRTGMGAVMGSKNLKAIAVRGSGDIRIARPKELTQLCAGLAEGIRALTSVIQDTAGEIAKESQHMLFGTHHEEVPEGWPGNQGLIDAVHNFFQAHGAGIPSPCLNCPMPCKPQFRVPGPQGIPEFTYLHCDTWLIFTTRTKSAHLDLAADSRLFMKCQKLGIDVFSAVTDAAFLTELFEKGIINEHDTDGITLRWGDRAALGPLVEKIARRQGIGDLFSEGILQAAQRIGRGAERYVYHTKGVELVHYSLYLIDAALAGAISQRGDQVRAHGATLMSLSAKVPVEYLRMLTSSLPPHLAETVLQEGYVERYEGKAGLVEHFERINSLSDILGVCRWWLSGVTLSGILSPQDRAQMLSFVTGRATDETALDRCNERVETIIRAFNVREGLRRTDDSIPSFYFKEKSVRHGVRLDPEKFDQVLTEYYALRGWDENGMPRSERLKDLGLSDVAAELRTREIIQ